MTVEIRFANFEDNSNAEYVRDIIALYEFLLPSWLRLLTIALYDSAPKDAPQDMICWSKGNPPYGYARISILSRWLDRDAKSQHSEILHEILHIVQRREYIFVWDRLLNPVQDRNEDLHAYLVEDHRELNEEFVDGLTEALLNELTDFEED